jgi:prepilin-type N-terminal cleavage/methylation domain-containing protein
VSIFLKKMNALNGFTLSELLIALAIIGLIAAFAIPKVLVSLQQSQQRALLTTAIKTLSDATQKIANEPPSLTAPNNTTWHLYDPYLNSADDNFIASGDPNNSFTMPGGVVISNLNVVLTNWVETIWLDANGAAPPNRIGQDSLFLAACFNPRGTCTATTYTVGGVAQESGTIGPVPDTYQSTGGNPTPYNGNVAFYNTLTRGS